MDCVGTYFTHCVIMFVFKVLRNGLLRYILYKLCKNVRFRVSALSRFRAFEFACFRAITGSVLPFSRFRVFAFSPFSRFRVFVFSQVESSRKTRVYTFRNHGDFFVSLFGLSHLIPPRPQPKKSSLSGFSTHFMKRDLCHSHFSA